jgi:hypothetical protein
VNVGDIVRIREDRGSKASGAGFHVGWYDNGLHVILAVDQRPWGKLVFLHPRVRTVDGWLAMGHCRRVQPGECTPEQAAQLRLGLAGGL